MGDTALSARDKVQVEHAFAVSGMLGRSAMAANPRFRGATSIDGEGVVRIARYSRPT